MTDKKDIALVLSSGGARGLSHIGAIEELEAQGYHIRSVAGCSMGALIGGIYAAGQLKNFREWMKSVDKWTLMNMIDISFSINHLIKGNKMMETLKEIVPDVNIEDLPIPFCAVSTDWELGEEVVFREGSLLNAIRASISLPGFLNPIRPDGRILIDGGVTNPLPLNRVVRHEGDLLVGVDVSGHDYEGQRQAQMKIATRNRRSLNPLKRMAPDSRTPNYVTLLTRASSLMIRQNSKLMIELTNPDILVDIQMNSLSGMDYDKSERLIIIGRNRTRQTLELYRRKQ